MKVTYDKDICTHSANCVKTLPSVFQVNDGKFVIIQDGAPEAQIMETVAACPSKALQIEE